ncbi:MAG: hypothetical protein WBF66_10460, partial [Dehalococcoidia bacterium]
MLTARLDKTGLRVLCGVCAHELGLILEEGVYTDGCWHRAVWLPPGWTIRYSPGADGALGPDTTVWYFSQRAAGRLREGREPLARQKQHWRSEGKVEGWLPFLPAYIKCPAHRCGQRQRLDADAIGLIGNPWPTRWLLTPCAEPGCPNPTRDAAGYCEVHSQGKVASRTPQAGYLRPLERSEEKQQYEEVLNRLR